MKIQKRQDTEFFGTKSGNTNAIAVGYATETTNYGEIATGILNKSTRGKHSNTPEGVIGDSEATLFSVGCGTSKGRKNALEVKGDGSVIISNGDNNMNVADKIKEALAIENSIELVKSTDNDLQYTLMVNDTAKGEINIPKDQFLKNVVYDDTEKQLVFTFVTLDEDEHIEKVPVGDLKDIYTAGDNITIENNKISADLSTAMTAISNEKTQRETTDNEIKSTLDTKADVSAIPTKTSQLTNDSGYLTEHQSLTDYAKVIEVNKLIENEKSNRETSIKEVSDKVNEYPGFKINDSECIISPYKVKQWSFNTIIKWGSDGYSYAINDNLLSDIPYPDTTFNLYISNSNKDNWNKITAYKVKSLDDNNSDFFTYISGADLDVSHKLYIGYSKIDNPNIEDLYIIQDLVKLGDNKYFCKIEDEFADMNAFIYDANNKTWYEVSCIASKVFTLFNCENTINDISDAIVYNGKGNYDYTPQDDGNIAIGSFAYAGSSGIAIGNYSNANAEQNIAIGNGATTEGDGCIALGLEAKVKDYQSNAVAIGYGVCVDKNTIMKIGHSGCEWITVDYPNEDVYIKGIGGFDGTNITVNDSLNTNIKSLKDVIDSKADKSDILAKLDNITAATTAEEVVTKFNALLTDLKAKRYMTPDATE